MRNEPFLIGESLIQMRIWSFLIRGSQTSMRNEPFLIGESLPQMRIWPFLIGGSQTSMRNWPFLIGERPLRMRIWPFLIGGSLSQIRNWLTIFKSVAGPPGRQIGSQRIVMSACHSAHPMCERDPEGLSYRPEIDGLRAVAVLSVIGFHAE